jgi:hypothetical protein
MTRDEIIRVARESDNQQHLLVLAGNDDAFICGVVARNKHVGNDVLCALAHNVDAGVRFWIARHPEVEDWILEVLSADRMGHVRKAASDAMRERARMLKKEKK